jgi:hypothetical protein
VLLLEKVEEVIWKWTADWASIIWFIDFIIFNVHENLEYMEAWALAWSNAAWSEVLLKEIPAKYD